MGILSTNVAVLLINILTGIMIARSLGPEGRGQLITLQIWPTLLSTTIGGGFNAAAIHFSGRHAEERPRFLGGVAVLSLLIGLLSTAIGLPISLHKLTLSPEHRLLLIVAFLSLPMIAFTDISMCISTGMGRMDIGNKGKLTRVFVTVFFLTLMYVTKFVSVSAVFCLVWFAILFALPQIVRFFKENDMWHWGNPRSTILMWLPFAGACFVGTVLQTIYMRLDQFLMTMYMSDYQRGLYGTATMLSELLLQVPIAISTVVFARSSQQAGSIADNLESCARLVRIGVVSVFAAGCIGMLTLPILLPLVYRPSFGPAAGLFNLILPGSLALAIAQPIALFYQGLGKPWKVILPQVISVITTLTGLILALRQGNLNGIAITASVGYVTYCLGMLFNITRDYGMRTALSFFPTAGSLRQEWAALQSKLKARLPQ